METNFNQNRLFKRLLMVFIIGVLTHVSSYAQSCACKGGAIQVSLDASGSATVTASMLLADNLTCEGTQTVTLMTTPTGSPIAGSPNVNCNHVGKTLYGKVSNGSNSCWTTILVEDKLSPVITCPTGNMTLSCVQMSTFVPTVVEPCGPIKLDTIAETTLTCNELLAGTSTNILKRVIRTYRAKDASGNVSAPCVIVFDVTVADFEAIDYPVNYDIAPGNNAALVCDGPWAKLPNDNPSPLNITTGTGMSAVTKLGTGVPTLSGVSLFNNPDQFCNLMVSYTDSQPIKEIGCTTKIMRTWSLIEWSCRATAPVTKVQVLEIVDNVGPIITNLQPLVLASTSNHTCEGRVTLPNPTLADNCSLPTTLTVDINILVNGDPATPRVIIKHGEPKVATLPVGTHLAVYTAYDACYNKTTSSVVVDVEDNTAPVAICDEFATIGLTSDGTAHVPASVFDDGSYDECKLQKFLVRRMNPTACGACEAPVLPGFKLLSSRNGHYYYTSDHPAIGKVAFKTAKAMGGYAVSLETPAEADWLIGQLRDKNLTDCYSIGLNILDGATFPEFKWESGATFNFNDFFGTTLIDKNIAYVCVLGLEPGPVVSANLNTTPARYIIEITDPCGWDSYADFCCADVPSNQMVAFRAVDASGNFNDCMVNAVIQDKIGPSITCPDHMTVDCDFAYDPSNLNKDFGAPEVTDNCRPFPIPVPVVVNSLNSCRIGTITRTFTVTDLGGRSSSCTQVITFRPNDDQIYSGPSNGDWPRDTMVTGCGNASDPRFLPAALGIVRLTDGACSLVGAQYVDEVYSFNQPNSPACFKILRKWTVIDWCQPKTSGGYETWERTQEIKVIDNIAPVVQLNGRPLIGNLPNVIQSTFDADCADGQVTLTATASDVCTNVLRSSYKIDANNNGTFDFNSAVSSNNTITASGTYPVGNHRVVYTWEDKCGNVTSVEQLFSIVNMKAPNAIVLNGLSISLMKVSEGEGMAEIWATDFDPDKKSTHPCGYPVLLSFEPTFKNNAGMLTGTPNKTYDCDQLGRQEVTIYIASLTPAGDIVETSVKTFIDVQDNANPKICKDGRIVSVSGVIATEANAVLENANIALTGSEIVTITDKSGSFDFSNMPLGGHYIVTPEKNDDHINGVSTLDLVMIQRHVLGIEKLNSPYKLIAADANKDGKVTASDLTELRKLILGTNVVLTQNTSWRFVDKAYTFYDVANAQGEAFPEVYNIQLLNTDMKTDFIAVKVGDVNGNAKANNLSNQTEVRKNNPLVITTDNKEFSAGTLISVPVKVSDVQNLSGMQFTLEFDNNMLSLTGVDAAALSINDSNFGFAEMHNGVVTMSWNTAKAINLNANTTLFTLSFLAKDHGSLDQAIAVNSAVTNSEAYDEESNIMNVVWRVNSTQGGFELFQNSPNPFKENTRISFNLPEAMNASISIHDVTGKVVKYMDVNGVKGLNTIELNQMDLSAGVMYYTFQAGAYKQTKKMVIIE
jgi:hypothetical protein